MAVEVIDRKPHPDVVKQAICKHCGCTLQYVPADTWVGKRGCMGEIWSVECITCPECTYAVVTKDPL